MRTCMSRPAMLLCVLVFSVGLYGPDAADASSIFTWTDRNGVVHFSDSPPPPDREIPEQARDLDEDTPIPQTLNELFGPVTEQPAAAGEPIFQEIQRVPSGALWSRGLETAPTESDADAGVFVDQHGPFTIGEIVEEVRLPREELCQWARRDLEILTDNWPVYREPGGRLRFQWARDPYRGARRYLDASARTAALAATRETLRRECDTPDDAHAQAAARDWLLRSALCEAERAELGAMERLGGHHPTQSLEDKREMVAKVCAEAAAI